MKAIRCREWGAPDVLRLEEAESPNLKQHQVRLRVRAAGVNFADSLMVGGTYQVKPQFPFTPGLEAPGEIVETPAAPKPPKPTRYAPSTPRHPKAWLGA